MKIRLLCENTAADMVWLAEWGFSALISFEGRSGAQVTLRKVPFSAVMVPVWALLQGECTA